MLILIMDGISKEIFESEQMIEANFAKFRQKANTLGLLALEDKDKLNILIGNSLLNTLSSAKQSRDELLSLVDKNNALEASIEEEKKGADISKSKMQALEMEKKELLSRLGAVAYEQAQRGALSDELLSLLKAVLDEEQDALRLSASSSAFEKLKGNFKLNKIRKNQAKRVYEIGKLLDERNLTHHLQGDKGAEFSSRLLVINKQLKHYKGKFEQLSSALEKKEDEKLTTINYSEKLEEAETQLSELAISYGIYLFENGSKWICENTPDKELDLLSEMLELQKLNESLETRIKQCHKEISIDELSLLIANDKKSIERLLVEKQKIEEEIDKINKHISLITDKIMDIKNHE